MKKFLVFIYAIMMCSTAQATGLVDLKFGRAQIADSQWNVSACTQTATCQIYSKNPGTAYKIPWTSGQIQWSTGDYIQFMSNSQKDANNPWLAVQYGSNGVAKTNMGAGHIINMGNNFFFFVGNDNNTGQLFSMTQGFSNTAGVSWTGTLNPSIEQVNQYAAGGSTTPLAAGQSSQPSATGTSTTNTTTTGTTTGPTTTTANTYNWGGGTFTVTGTDTPTTTTTSTTPVTTTTWSNGTTTTSNGNTTTTTDTTWNYTVTSQMLNPPVSPYKNTNINGVYILQVNAGAVNKVTADQSGHGNYEEIRLGGSNNNINVGQGYTFNKVGVASESGAASIENVLGLSVLGNSNNITSSQVGTANSIVANVTGNTNNANLNQLGNNNQTYSIINGNGNILSIGQNGNSNISAVNLYGNNNMAAVTQTGDNHGAVLSLVNAGGANNVSVVQTGTGDAYSLQQTCTNPAGCSVSVIRNKQ